MVFFTFHSQCFCCLLIYFHGHVCHLFIYLCKIKFPCFLLPLIFSSCFTWSHLYNAVILITCLLCKLMRQALEKAAKSQDKLKQKSYFLKKILIVVKKKKNVLCSLTSVVNVNIISPKITHTFTQLLKKQKNK